MTNRPTMRRAAAARTDEGVTLLEMLVALALMGMLASALYMSLHIGFRANARAESALAPARAAGMALELVRRDLESAMPPVGILAGPFLGEEGSLLGTGEPADALSFHAVVEDVRNGGPAVRRVEFALEPEEDGGGYVLVRRETANLLAPTAPEPEEETLCRGVLAFELAYFDGYVWSEYWDSTARGDVLPLAVEARLAVRAHGPARGEARLFEDPLTAERYELVRLFALPCGRPSDPEDDLAAAAW